MGWVNAWVVGGQNLKILTQKWSEFEKVWLESGRNMKILAEKCKMRPKIAKKHKLRHKNMNHDVKQS